MLVLREGKADGFTNKLDERWTLLTLHDDLNPDYALDDIDNFFVPENQRLRF